MLVLFFSSVLRRLCGCCVIIIIIITSSLSSYLLLRSLFLDIIIIVGLDCGADPSPACLQDSQIPVFEITGKKSLENVSPQR